MKVLYLKDNYDIGLKITVPDVAYLKRIKRANRFFVYIRNTPSPPPFPQRRISGEVQNDLRGGAHLPSKSGLDANKSPQLERAYLK
jgi:hypothetical protein